MTASSAGRRLRIAVSGLSSDAHTRNLVHLQPFLEDRGHEVADLGTTMPDATILWAGRTCSRRAASTATAIGTASA